MVAFAAGEYGPVIDAAPSKVKLPGESLVLPMNERTMLAPEALIALKAGTVGGGVPPWRATRKYCIESVAGTVALNWPGPTFWIVALATGAYSPITLEADCIVKSEVLSFVPAVNAIVMTPAFWVMPVISGCTPEEEPPTFIVATATVVEKFVPGGDTSRQTP